MSCRWFSCLAQWLWGQTCACASPVLYYWGKSLEMEKSWRNGIHPTSWAKATFSSLKSCFAICCSLGVRRFSWIGGSHKSSFLKRQCCLHVSCSSGVSITVFMEQTLNGVCVWQSFRQSPSGLSLVSSQQDRWLLLTVKGQELPMEAGQFHEPYH